MTWGLTTRNITSDLQSSKNQGMPLMGYDYTFTQLFFFLGIMCVGFYLIMIVNVSFIIKVISWLLCFGFLLSANINVRWHNKTYFYFFKIYLKKLSSWGMVAVDRGNDEGYYKRKG